MTEFFGGKRWSELGAADLQWHGQSDALFSVEAYCYFLPAYLIASAIDPQSLGICIDHLVYRFGPRTDDLFLSERLQSVLSSLSESQRRAALAYFESVLTRDGDFEGYGSRAVNNLVLSNSSVS